MKLEDLYNFHDGIIPASRTLPQTMTQEEYTRSIAKAAERQFIHQLRLTQRNLCTMREMDIYAASTLKRLCDTLLSHRNNAVKARLLSREE